MTDTEAPTTTNAAAAAVMPFSLPYIPGAAWLPKYSGEPHALTDFKERLYSLFHVYPLTEEQKVSILTGQLTGAAQREVKSWPTEEKRTVKGILARLRGTFDTRTSAEIKMRFYGCKQRAQDSIRDYALNLQEALRAIQQTDPGSVQETDKLLTEQFIEGLLSSAHRAQLRLMFFQNPDLTFAQFKDRAIRVLRESATSGAINPRRPALTYHQEAAPSSMDSMEADAQALNQAPSKGLHHQAQERRGIDQDRPGVASGPVKTHRAGFKSGGCPVASTEEDPVVPREAHRPLRRGWTAHLPSMQPARTHFQVL